MSLKVSKHRYDIDMHDIVICIYSCSTVHNNKDVTVIASSLMERVQIRSTAIWRGTYSFTGIGS